MKKKIIIILLILLVLYVLLVPEELVVSDGGTHIYKARIYEITDYHSLREKKENDDYIISGFIVGRTIEILGIEVYNDTHFVEK
jgi:hypothetical protein